MTKDTTSILDLIAKGYSLQYQEKGTSHEAVLWAKEEDQIARFQKLFDMVKDDFPTEKVSINDLGCGYGAFFDFIKMHPSLNSGHFYGYDICPDFIIAAQQLIQDPRAYFDISPVATHKADFSFASGTFSLRGPETDEHWTLYIKDSLRNYFKMTQKAMVFNLLDQAASTKYDWLYYADPDDFFEFCSKALSKDCDMSLDPELDGFTIAVRK